MTDAGAMMPGVTSTSPDLPMTTRVSGVGSWPGESPREAVRAVRDLLGDGVPHLPELPGRGVGADMIGRAASLLEGLHVETQPFGWRLVDRPGRDEGRAAAHLRHDLDELAEAYEGWQGPLKLQVSGPWTLAATLELTRGERVVSDHGARRDLTESLAEGLRTHVAEVARLVPGAHLVVQVDEPAVPAVLEGRLPTQSGYGRLRAVDRSEVRDSLRVVLDAAGDHRTVVHCCAAEVPVTLLHEAGADGLSLDTTLLDGSRWEQLAAAVEGGAHLWAGAVRVGADWRTAHDRLTGAWGRIGLTTASLADVVVTPTCGLAGATPTSAVATLRTAKDLAEALAESGR